MYTGYTEGAFPFGFAVPLLIPLAQRAMELCGDPLGELSKEIERLPAGYPIEELWVTTWTDSRGHRLVQRHEKDFQQPFESYDRRCEARIEGIQGGMTIMLRSPPIIDELRFYKIESPVESAARELLHAWTIALIEHASDGRLVSGFDLPPDLVMRSRALLRSAATYPPVLREPRLLVFPPRETPVQFGIQHRGDIGSGFELNIVGPLPRENDTIEAIRRLRPKGITAMANRPDAAAIARILLNGPVRPPWHLQMTDHPRGSHRTLFSMRLQNEDGDGPAAFVQWQMAEESLGHREGIDALFIGTVRQVRAALKRLIDQLDLNAWESAPSTLANGEQWL